ncbi:MAG TPA: FUSC family protein [Rhodanobacteraceae bacterium]|nr:FUSC family protein [Rhodanobacteraceae bacterium]
MPTPPHWRAHLLAGLTRIKPRDVPWQVALRNTAGVTLPLLAGVHFGHLDIGLGISAGALMVMFADQPGPYRLRLRNILLTSVAGALATLIGLGIGSQLLPLLVVTALWTFAAGLLVALGPDLTRVGLISTLLLVITAASSGVDEVPPLAAALLVLVGGALQALLAILAWPLNRYRPERLALASAYTALAVAARQTPETNAAPPASSEINHVQAVLLGDDRSQSRALESLRILAALFERIRVELVALREYQAALADHDADGPVRALARASARLLVLVAASLRDTRIDQAECRRLLARFDTAQSALEAAARAASAPAALAAAATRAVALRRPLRAALRNVDAASSIGAVRASAAERQLPTALRPAQPLAVLRANLKLDSIACRHALRSASCVTLALGLSHLLPVAHAYWMPMTAAIVLKPDFGATVNYGLLRVAGTLSGLLLTSLLLHYLIDEPWLRIALLALLCYGFRQWTTRHYGVGVAALSGLVVLLEALAGEAPGPVMHARALGTLGGSALALIAYAAWPTWERGRVRTALARMLEDYARYLSSTGGDLAERRNARSACRVSRSNAHASLERLRHEPRSGEGLLALGDALFATGSRLARAALLLDALLGEGDNDALRPHLEPIVALRDLAAARGIELAACVREQRQPVLDIRVHDAAVAVRQTVADTDPHGLVDIADRIEDILATLAFLLTPKAAE